MQRLTQKAASPMISTSDGPLSPAGLLAPAVLSRHAAHRQARLRHGGHTPAPREQGHLSLRSPSARNLGRWQESPEKTCLSTIGTSALRGGPFAPASMALGSQSEAELMHGPLVRTRGSAGWTGSCGHLGISRGAPKQVASFAEGSPLRDGRS